ncbi:MAG: DNA-binding protein WhiA [Clostridia bacterium]|nr:DNA-binding protein WhiA [Clostridia bacterium]
MSFASEVKQELCKTQIVRKCCAVAECYGILLFCNTFSADMIRIVTESADFAARLPKLFRKAFGFSFDREPEAAAGGKRAFEIWNSEKLDTIFQTYGTNRQELVSLHVNYGMVENDCCRVSFLRGAFLAGGSVTDPEKRYHLELATTHRKVGAESFALLLDMDMNPKDTDRNGSYILYFKQSNAIEDFLTMLGAPICAMRIMEAKVEKDLRNDVNRRVNCETANLTKVVDAAQEQLAAIRILEAKGILQTLPEKLLQTAALRRENPEATLMELAAMVRPPMSKSAINHRMRKLIELSKG